LADLISLEEFMKRGTLSQIASPSYFVLNFGFAIEVSAQPPCVKVLDPGLCKTNYSKGVPVPLETNLPKAGDFLTPESLGLA